MNMFIASYQCLCVRPFTPYLQNRPKQMIFMKLYKMWCDSAYYSDRAV
jgi:hypothetical protein